MSKQNIKTAKQIAEGSRKTGSAKGQAKRPRITQPVLKVLRVFLDSSNAEIAGSDVRERTGLATGTLYPILLRLEGYGWLESQWEDIDPSEAGRPRKRLYRITNSGADAAQSEFDALMSLTQGNLTEGYA